MPRAFPTALAAFGFPMCFAMRLYVLIFPRGILYSACSTFCWKGVHWSSLSMSRLNLVSTPFRKRLIDSCSFWISLGGFSLVSGCSMLCMLVSSSILCTSTRGVSL